MRRRACRSGCARGSDEDEEHERLNRACHTKVDPNRTVSKRQLCEPFPCLLPVLVEFAIEMPKEVVVAVESDEDIVAAALEAISDSLEPAAPPEPPTISVRTMPTSVPMTTTKSKQFHASHLRRPCGSWKKKRRRHASSLRPHSTLKKMAKTTAQRSSVSRCASDSPKAARPSATAALAHPCLDAMAAMEHAARLMLERGLQADVVYTSVLKRAIRSAWILLAELGQTYRPVVKD